MRQPPTKSCNPTGSPEIRRPLGQLAASVEWLSEVVRAYGGVHVASAMRICRPSEAKVTAKAELRCCSTSCGSNREVKVLISTSRSSQASETKLHRLHPDDKAELGKEGPEQVVELNAEQTESYLHWLETGEGPDPCAGVFSTYQLVTRVRRATNRPPFPPATGRMPPRLPARANRAGWLPASPQRCWRRRPGGVSKARLVVRVQVWETTCREYSPCAKNSPMHRPGAV